MSPSNFWAGSNHKSWGKKSKITDSIDHLELALDTAKPENIVNKPNFTEKTNMVTGWLKKKKIFCLNGSFLYQCTLCGEWLFLTHPFWDIKVWNNAPSGAWLIQLTGGNTVAVGKGKKDPPRLHFLARDGWPKFQPAFQIWQLFIITFTTLPQWVTSQRLSVYHTVYVINICCLKFQFPHLQKFTDDSLTCFLIKGLKWQHPM